MKLTADTKVADIQLTDRFLDRTWEVPVWWWTERRWEDTISDYASNDARIGFQNAAQQTVTFAGQNGSYTFAAGSWADSEIEFLDAGAEAYCFTFG